MRVLLTEDIEIARKVASLVLSSIGCDIDVARNGQAAIDAVQKKEYDLIFMDLGLPDMRGELAATRIRTHLGPNTAVRIVALTAHASEGLNSDRLFDLVLEKPLTKAGLFKMLKALELDHFLQNQA